MWVWGPFSKVIFPFGHIQASAYYLNRIMPEKRTDEITSQHIMRNRIKKAARVAGILDAIKQLRPNVVEAFSETEWSKVEGSMQAKISPETRMMIVAFLKFRYKVPII